jgi:NAD(P)-dependent dehydrogenase (short-subunit alcohol dehydrogenase family)
MSNFRSVSGKVAVITGAARGLGKGIADRLATEAVDVVMADKLPAVKEAFQEIKQANPANRGYAVILDVSDEEAMKDLVASAASALGRLDIMVNNAGMHLETGNVWETETAKLDRIMSVNFKGIFFGCKYAAREMIRQKSGSIINIGSFFGKVGHAGSASYGASKGAVHTMTQALALELAPYQVNVNALCPGLAASEMHWGFVKADAETRGITFEQMQELELKQIPLGRYGYGHDMAGAIMWLASESGAYVTGQLINVNGGLDFT